MTSHRSSAALLTLLIMTGTLMLVQPLAAHPLRQPAAQASTPTPAPNRCADSYRQTPGANDNYAELTNEQKTIAFEDVITNQSYGDFSFALNQNNMPPGALLPVLPKAIAGIESDWQQYKTGLTNSSASCDYGLMQVNGQLRSRLFDLNPSLRADTRANIAAGANVLAASWDSGTNGTSPLVNDTDPEQLTNWYYALSGYNGGPGKDDGQSKWNNNPNCGDPLICDEKNYSRSRPWNKRTPNSNDLNATVNWVNLNPDDFPYQERILYNLQYPRKPVQAAQTLWSVSGLGMLPETSRNRSGLLPDDALFRSKNATNEIVTRARNLLLFRHRATVTRLNVSQRLVDFEFDLPLPATVTVEILRYNADGSTQTLLQQTTAGNVGWNEYVVNTTIGILSGDVYRIRATRGDPNNLIAYYEGQYINTFTFVSDALSTASAALQPRLYAIPLGSNTNFASGAVEPIYLRNGAFHLTLPTDATQPDYWHIQGIYGPGVSAASKVHVIGTAFSPSRFLRVEAAPRGRVEVTQRFTVPPGDYVLNYDLGISGVPLNSTSQLIVRVRSVTGDAWQQLRAYNRAASGYGTYPHRITLREPSVLSFLVLFDANDTTSTFDLARVELKLRSTATSNLAPAAVAKAVSEANAYPAPAQRQSNTEALSSNSAYPPPAATPTGEPIVLPTNRPTTTRIPSTSTPTSTPSATPTSTPSPTPYGGSFPSQPIRDTFNRAVGGLGSAWLGDVGGYQVNNNAAKVLGGGAIYAANSYGPNQEVYVTLTNINPAAQEIDLLLKAQDTGQKKMLEVWYTPSTSSVKVLTYNNGTWVTHGSIAATFQNGDRFGARARSSGQVDIYQNSTLIGSVQVSGWPYLANGGAIGVWVLNGTNTVLDDFGGGALP